MNSYVQQYRFARIEAENITRARLEARFKNGITSIAEFENSIAQLLSADQSNCALWRRSDMERSGCRDGVRFAALEFFWSRRQELRRVN